MEKDEEAFHKQIEEATERCRQSEPRQVPQSLRAQARAILAVATNGKGWTMDWPVRPTTEDRLRKMRLCRAIRQTAFHDQAAHNLPRYRVSITYQWNEGLVPTITMVVMTYPTNVG